jgi:hypothetical protein
LDEKGRTTFIDDVYRDDGRRFVVHAGDKYVAFLELEYALR